MTTISSPIWYKCNSIICGTTDEIAFDFYKVISHDTDKTNLIVRLEYNANATNIVSSWSTKNNRWELKYDDGTIRYFYKMSAKDQEVYKSYGMMYNLKKIMNGI